MQLRKKTCILLVLGWVTTTALMAYLVGYYNLQCKDYANLLQEYKNMYNDLSQNYTQLLNDYVGLLNKYEAEKANHTQLVEKYESVTMRVNLCINYAEHNGTMSWYNNTIAPLGCNLLNATRMVAIVNYTYWSAYQASFVDAINGVANNPPYYWMWLYWDENENMWKYGPVGADCYILKPNERIMWRYEIPGW